MISMPKFAMSRVKVERIILFVKIGNRYFERKYNVFQHASSEVLMAVL